MPRDGDLRRIFRERLPEAHWTSIETGGTGRGIPDSHFCFPDGSAGWIEYKLTGTSKVAIRPEQAAWAMRQTRMSGFVMFAVRWKCKAGPRRLPRDALYLVPGRNVTALMDAGLASSHAWSWEGGPARWDWDAVRKILKWRTAVAIS